ncbi:hypothetical protein BKA00_004253 [Actinomadura coerulea]|uniref:Uncharacterized protein n=1 Tax=Actinomadura coerulea TaxID=46159 RepID=A0A7X0L0M3_9ACTN|nr:hypothetical protein [Actinomadura coerulea]MBB6397339.1 hypothetical protein [Actinomadura coerulea]GGQ02024.1 hypothetical protein GCM10010187_17060 [Actinomadura coerulea]
MGLDHTGGSGDRVDKAKKPQAQDSPPSLPPIGLGRQAILPVSQVCGPRVNRRRLAAPRANPRRPQYDENGNQIFVWEQDDKRSQVTIRDPSTGNIVTNQWSTNSWIQRQLDKERWYSLND